MSNTNYVLELTGRFTHAIQESYAQYNAHGARSPKKLHPLHQWMADEMRHALGSEYLIQSLRKSGGENEETIHGKYYDKKVDVAVSKKGGEPLAIISVKFITSNFKQNANNYFEHLMGETANIRRRNVGFGHFMVIPEVTPYLDKEGNITSEERIGTGHVQKYINLAHDEDHPHKPDAIGISIICLPVDDLNDVSRITLADLGAMSVSEDVKNALKGELSLSNFIHKMKNLVEEKE